MTFPPLLRRLCLAVAIGSFASGAAHPGIPAGGGFPVGLLHPLLGLDHLAAMLAVGLCSRNACAASRGRRIGRLAEGRPGRIAGGAVTLTVAALVTGAI
jgi:urease accessory protein